jgi:hypothetical protein
MGRDHERYEQLAVGHVLGGLQADDASSFRAHLLGCRDCRMVVAELRGIASDLEAAERDERARALVTTELAEHDEVPDPAPPASRVGVRHVTIAALVVVLLAGAMAFWNLHLRTTTAAATGVAEQQSEVLGVLADGLRLTVAAEHPVRGLAAVADDRVAMSLVGLPDVADGERLVIWREHPEGLEPVRTVSRRELGAGPAAFVVDAGGAEAVVVSLEREQLGDGPRGRELARVELRDELTPEQEAPPAA